MSQKFEKLIDSYLKTEITTSDSGYLQVLEAGLQSLTLITSQKVDPLVSQLEKDYFATRDDLESSYNHSKEQLEDKTRSQTQAVESEHARQVEEFEKTFEGENSKVNNQAHDTKKEISNDFQNQLSEVKENFDYETMISEVVEKETLKNLELDKQKKLEKIESSKSELNDLQTQAQDIVESYKTKLPAIQEQVEIDQHNENYFKLYETYRDNAESKVYRLSDLFLPKFFLTSTYMVIAGVLSVLVVLALWLAYRTLAIELTNFIVVAASVFLIWIVLLIVLGILLAKKARAQLEQTFISYSRSELKARLALEDYHLHVNEDYDKKVKAAQNKRQEQLQNALEKKQKLENTINHQNQQQISSANKKFDSIIQNLKSKLDQQLSQAKNQKQQQLEKIKTLHDTKQEQLKKDFDDNLKKVEEKFESFRQRLKEYWIERLTDVHKLYEETNKLEKTLFTDWHDQSWRSFKPAKTHQPLIKFGTIKMDLNEIAQSVREIIPPELTQIDSFDVPATLSFPNRCSMFLDMPHTHRENAINLVKATMTRLFACQPAGRVNFTIFDPIGLGENFVGFMHAADYEKNLVGGRIWTKAEHIQKTLSDMTTHMENVIQKYLRNEFETIEEYNLQAGELAEPYRFLVIADFPTNFSDESIRHLASIINSGPRCGVYTFIVYDQNQKLPDAISTDDLAQNGVHLSFENDRFNWHDHMIEHFTVKPDSAPDEQLLTEIVQKVGSASIDATRVEVPFETIAPQENNLWSLNSADQIEISIGRAGAKRLQYLSLGKGVNQHILIAGKTGSGKSTLFHAMITNMALWYSPDEVEMYLIDFKQGVEFKTYATHKLPHARAVAIESDREFGLSILQRLDNEMTARGEKFRMAAVQDVASYRKTTQQKMSRIVLIIDEFHILFADDDKIAHDSTMLLEKLVRQGRAFGIHVILGSQSLVGAAGISRSIIGQMAVRIALHCSDMDAQFILNEDNPVASRLTRPGEAIYNDAGGMVVGNSPFQVAWLPKKTQDNYLSNVEQKSVSSGIEKSMIVFEGNVPADISTNQQLMTQVYKPLKNTDPVNNPPQAFIGEPITIKAPTAVDFPRQNASNMLIVGQQEIAMSGILSAGFLSLLSDLSPQAATFTIFDDLASQSKLGDKLNKICDLFDHKCRFPKFNQLEEVITEISQDVKTRLENGAHNLPSHFLIITNLQRYRKLYRKEEDWSFGASDQPASADKLFTEILQEGPAMGIHTIVGADTYNTVDRVFARQTLREFNNRVLFQMSAADSNNLIDTPIANSLGFQRAILYNDEQGILEKFRFYAAPQDRLLEELMLKSDKK